MLQEHALRSCGVLAHHAGGKLEVEKDPRSAADD